MSQISSRRRRARRLLAAAAGATLCLGLLPATSHAQPPAKPGDSGLGKTKGDELGTYDSRKDGGAKQVLQTRALTLAAKPSDDVRALRADLGQQGIVDMDPLTGTPRQVSRLDGFLTGKSRKKPVDIALGYVRAHTGTFGLDEAAISRLSLRKDYVDAAGTHHLSFVQTVAGVPVFGNGLKAHVTREGELISLDGSPVAHLPAGSLGAPKLTAAQARDAAVANVYGHSRATVKAAGGDAAKTTSFDSGDQAKLVVFQTVDGPRLAWQTIATREGYIHVVDAQTGKVLFRQSTQAKDNGEAWGNYPGAAQGGKQRPRGFTARGWLPNNSQTLNGTNAHVYLDINDNDIADPGEEVGPSSPRQFNYDFKDFTPTVGPPCAAQFKCSWDPKTPNSWKTNANQNAVQMFYFLGNFHDHLEAFPIGFTRAAGNFDARDGDAVEGNAIDGANKNNGLPDSNHVDNANMNTFPDGTPPRMQMYLFHDPSTPDDPFIAGNSGDEADIVYHEYTHGLSNRLVVDAAGVSTLGNIQAGSMGEAWSDWYAFDFLVDLGLQNDDPRTDGDVRVGEYVGAGQDLIRTQPLDCSVGSTSAKCPGTPGAGAGGYTYGDFGKIIGRPEVHADGEIWAETLWDVRKALGVDLTEALVTRAMELSPANPSFLDMRNAILTADQVIDGGRKQKKLWQLFAARGMGFFAGAVDGDDAQPVEDFSTPPPPNTPKGSLAGNVTDKDTGKPVAGATVAFGGHNSGFAGDYAAVTDTSGNYTITGIIPGTYPKVFAKGTGYDLVTQTVSVSSSLNRQNWQVRRDWAASAGGAAVSDFNGPDFGAGCNQVALIDQSQGNGWVSDAMYTGQVIAPRFAVVKLPAAVNVIDFAIDPTSSCGVGGSASTGDYKVETSADGTTWTVAAQGHFTPGDRNRMNIIAPAAGTGTGVKFIRYTMLGTQLGDIGGSCPGNFGACQFVSTSELGVHGVAS